MLNESTVAALALLVIAQVERMAGMDLRAATRAFIDGDLPAAAYEGYQHVWACAREPHDLMAHQREWYAYPTDPAAQMYARELIKRVPMNARGAV